MCNRLQSIFILLFMVIFLLDNFTLPIDNSIILWLHEHMNSYSYDVCSLEEDYGRISNS